MSARCKTCGAEVIWTQTESGKRMQVDAKPIGPVFIVEGDLPEGSVPVAVTVKARAQKATLHLSHFATCPDADKHRKRTRE